MHYVGAVYTFDYFKISNVVGGLALYATVIGFNTWFAFVYQI